MVAVQTVEALLATLDLDEAGEARAAIARGLAAKFDEAVASSTATTALAIAGISKELRDVITEILEASGDAEDFVAGVFAQVGDPPHA